MYTTVFDIADTGFSDWKFVMPGFVFIAICLVQLRRWNRPPKYWTLRLWRPFSVLTLSFAILWTVLAGTGTYTRYSSLAEARRTGKFDVVEGKVEDFDPMPAAGHKRESFRVGNTQFAYSDFELNGGFRNARSHGGPLGPGKQVRISFVGQTIIKLEVATRDL